MRPRGFTRALAPPFGGPLFGTRTTSGTVTDQCTCAWGRFVASHEPKRHEPTSTILAENIMLVVAAGAPAHQLVAPQQEGKAGVARSRRVVVAVLAAVAGCAAVCALVVQDGAAPALSRHSSALLEYYQPWQARSTPAVNEQELVGGYAAQRVRSAERGVMRALYRSANGGDDAGPTPEPAVAGAPSYASELNFLKQNLPSRRAEASEEQAVAAQEATLREEEQLEQEQAVADQRPAEQAVGSDTLKSKAAIKDAKDLEAHAPAGYHLAWVANSPKPQLASPPLERSQMARENGGRDELPFFPMTPVDVDEHPDAHVEWVAPGPCMLRDGTDMQYTDRECQHHQVIQAYMHCGWRMLYKMGGGGGGGEEQEEFISIKNTQTCAN